MRTHLLHVLLYLLATAPVAHAQSVDPSLTDLLQRKLTPGERVQILDANQSTITGRFDGMLGTSIELIVGGARRQIPLVQIYQVRRERSEADGVLMGALSGAAAGLAHTSITCHGESEHGDCVRVAQWIFVPTGALVGALLDWRIRRFETVFRRSTRASERFHIGPLLGRNHTGVVVGVAVGYDSYRILRTASK